MKKTYLFGLALFASALNAFATENKQGNLVYQTQVSEFLLVDAHSANKSLITDKQCRALFPTQWTKGNITRYKNADIDVAVGPLALTSLDTKGSVIEAKKMPTPPHAFVRVVRHGSMQFMLNGKKIKTPVSVNSRFRSSDPSEKTWALDSAYCVASVETRFISSVDKL